MSRFKEKICNIREVGKEIIFIIGFLLCIFPIVSNVITSVQQENVIETYQTAVTKQSKNDLKEIRKNAVQYNELLFRFQDTVIDQVNLYDEMYYNQQLDCSGTGIMGSLEIPKIDVKLPIYHGTGEAALSNGVGHLKGTSLPVGGDDTHAVLSGHRGLPSSKLLIRMDEIENGDYFFINTCDQTLAYEVSSINVVEPDDVSDLQIKEGEDLVSIVTCTPYGINTHRLIVTGIRVDYKKSSHEQQQQSWPSFREILFTLLPFVLILCMIVMNWRDRRSLKRAKNEKDASYYKHNDYIICANGVCTRGKGQLAGERRSIRKRFYTDHHTRRNRKYKKRRDWISMY